MDSTLIIYGKGFSKYSEEEFKKIFNYESNNWPLREHFEDFCMKDNQISIAMSGQPNWKELCETLGKAIPEITKMGLVVEIGDYVEFVIQPVVNEDRVPVNEDYEPLSEGEDPQFEVNVQFYAWVRNEEDREAIFGDEIDEAELELDDDYLIDLYKKERDNFYEKFENDEYHDLCVDMIYHVESDFFNRIENNQELGWEYSEI